MKNPTHVILFLALFIGHSPILKAADVPTPCAAVGYMTKTFATVSNFSTKTVDIEQTYRSGYQWYPWNWFSGSSPKNHLILAGGTISASGETGPNGQLSSAAKTASAPYFVGTAFGGGLCVEFEISYDVHDTKSSQGFPAFWAMAKEHLDTQLSDQWTGQPKGFEHFAEWDILEAYKIKNPGFLSSWMDWYGIYQKTCPNSGYCKVASSFVNTPGAIPDRLDWEHKWHRVTGVWVPATQSKLGSIQTFVDDRPLAPPYTWKQFSNQGSPPTKSTPWTFGIIDQQHLVLLLGSNDTPIRVRRVRVFQSSSANNETN